LCFISLEENGDKKLQIYQLIFCVVYATRKEYLVIWKNSLWYVVVVQHCGNCTHCVSMEN